MNKKNHIIPLAAGILAGTMLTLTAGAAVNYVRAYRSDQAIYLNGERINCRTYNIENKNYIRLTDLCGALGVDCRWENNVFSPGPLPDLPSPTCDWSRFPEAELPPEEVRHFSHPGRESVFVRNLYETRRMQYTIYNALGKEPSAWRNGKLLASVSLTVSPEDEDFVKVSWPWRASDLEALVHSRPNSRFSVEAWDYYVNGVFQYTRYCVVSL